MLCLYVNILNAIETTSNIPAGYYVTAEYIKDVEKFAQKIPEKFGNKDGPFCTNGVVIEIFLHDLEHFFNRYLSYTFFHLMIDHFNVNFFS